jgi:hypothetical protein
MMTEEALDRRIIEVLMPHSLILDIGCGDDRLVNAPIG